MPIESVKLHERLIEPKPILTGNETNKNDSETSKNENSTLQHEDTTVSFLPRTIDKVSEKPAKVENENNEIKLVEFTKLVEAKELKSDNLFSNLRINKSLIEQNKALLKKVESISESVSNYCSKPSPIESVLQKHVLSGKTKTDSDNKKDESTNYKQSVTEKNSENGTIKEQTENDNTNNRPIKSKITELLEKRRAEELEKEEKQKEKEAEKQKSEAKAMKSKFDGEKNLFLLEIILFSYKSVTHLRAMFVCGQMGSTLSPYRIQ